MSNYGALSVKKLMRQAVRDLRASKHDAVVDITTEIIEREQDHAGAHAVQFSALFKAKRFEQARRIGTAAAELNPKSVFILNNQACLQLEAKQPAAASGLLKSLIDQYGERGQWLYNLALAQRMVGNFDYAITTFSRTLDFDEQHDRAAFQLADCLTLVGNHEQATRAFDYVRLLRSKNAPSHSNYIHHAVVNNTISKSDLELELALWHDRFIPSDKRYENHSNSDSAQLKIGFLMGKLPDSWATTLIAPVVNGLAQMDDQVSVYWHDEQLDPELFDQTVNVVQSARFTDADFARRVRADDIEIMVDICGMRIGSRKTFFAIGCQRGVSHEVLNTWASILHQAPDWRLHLASDNQLVNKQLKSRLRDEGIDDSRLMYGSNVSLNAQTIALDNFTENNPAATITALSQGAIVISTRGELFPAQHTARILKQCGREAWLTDSSYGYQKLALEHANKAKRQGIGRSDFDASGLADISNFVKQFRQAINEQ